MAVFTGSDLRSWRESQKITAADLAERISCDVTTIYRYESGKLKPDPDVMYQICCELGDPTRWCMWMRTEYPTSYARLHPEPVTYDTPGTLISYYAAVAEGKKLTKKLFGDAADGTIDDQNMAMKVRNNAKEIIQSAQRLIILLEGGEKNASKP